jgi:hypothetical protein
MVINCTAGMERKLHKIDIVVAAAEVFGCVRLDIRRVTGCDKWCPILSG